MHHQNLTVGRGAGTDADHRDAQRLADPLGQRARHALEHQQLDTGRLQFEGLTVDLLGLKLVAPLHLEAAKDVDGLRGEAEVTAHRHPVAGEVADGVAEPVAPFHLDHAGTGCHQAGGVLVSLLGGGVTHEGHVGDDQRIAGTASHTAGVIDHLIHVDRQGILTPLQHHAQRIADEQHMGPLVVEQLGKSGIIGGDGGELLTILLHLQQAGGGDLAHKGSCTSALGAMMARSLLGQRATSCASGVPQGSTRAGAISARGSSTNSRSFMP